MAHKPIVAGNWKLNGSPMLCQEFRECLEPRRNVDIWLFPASVHIALLADLFAAADVQVGAQNVSAESSGAFTGEVSATMVAEVGGTVALAGHSERRSLYNESDAVVGRKLGEIRQAGMTPVLCIGESLQERENGQAQDVVRRQLSVLKTSQDNDVDGGLVVAYEPVWAIGTGQAASSEQVQEMHAYIRSQLQNLRVEGSQTARILYGGSVKAGNAHELFSNPDVDGFLVGGASLEVAEFNQICMAVGS